MSNTLPSSAARTSEHALLLPSVAAADEGDRIGRFVLARRLGAGGMGEVWSAYDPQLDRKVAIKRIRGASSASERVRLQREAQALAKLAHPNVVPVFEVGDQNGELFVVMEQIDGLTLRAWCREHRALGWRRILALVVDAGRGLAAAHRAGLVHRDFKPDNVLVGADGRARVVDFGLVRVGPREPASAPASGGAAAEHGTLGESITRDDAVLGTPAYMAPEQFLAELVDARTDQFAFCVTAIEALTGERPFRGETRLAIAAAVTGGAPRVRDDAGLPRWLQRELVRGLAVFPHDRHDSMDALLAALDRDPGRARRRALVAGLALVAIGGAAWTAGRTAAAPQPCRSSDERIATLLPEARRTAIGGALLAAEVGYEPELATSLVARIDAYAHEWADAHRDACEATHVRGEQSEALLDLRMRCLARREDALAATVELLADGGREPALAAPRMIAELPDVAPCSDPEFVAAGDGALEPAIVAARADVERTIARAHAQTQAGRLAEARATAAEAIAAADTLGLAATRAEAQLAEGLAVQALGDAPGAQPSLSAALFDALAADDDDTAVGAAIALVYGVGHMLGDDAGGTLWARHARALVHRPRVEPARAWQVDNAIGVLHLRHDRLADATVAFEAALARIGDVAIPTRADILNNLGAVALRKDDFHEAERRFEAALALDRDVFGEHHPRIADALSNLGTTAVRAGDPALAEARLRQALAIRERALPPDHPQIAGTLGNLAGIALEQDETDEAIALLQRVRAFYDADAEHYPVQRATVRHNLAVVLHEAGQDTRALGPAREALALRIATFGERHLDVAGSRAVLGNVLVGLGEPRAAVEELARALALRTELGAGAYMLATTRISLARARWALQAGDREAIALVRAALVELVALAPDHADTLAEARAWLAEHAAG